jgi:PKD repeat protein
VTVVVPNEAPEAQFTTSENGLTLSVNGAGSTDADGTIAGYAWNFGDGTAVSTGTTAMHTYAAAGDYNVTLTVTDNDGATNTLTKPVTVSAAAAPFAVDAFGRSATNTWGNADVGGAWSAATSANFSVTGGRDFANGERWVGTVDSSDHPNLLRHRAAFHIGIDKPATGNGVYVTLKPRMTSSGAYHAEVRYLSNGSVAVKLVRRVGSVDTVLVQDQTVPGVTVGAGDRLNVKVQAFGTSPTTLRAKVWAVGSAEPTAWTASVTDSTSGLQAAGNIGLGSYLSGSATNAPVFTAFDGPVGWPAS